MTDEEFEWKKYRYNIMNEHFLDRRKIYRELAPILPSREEYVKTIFDRDPYDNTKYPTHRMKNPDGTYSEYYAASRHYTKVDPYVTDRHSIHYASNHWVYLLLKNKKTAEWEFPTRIMRERQSIKSAKDELFENISGKAWEIVYCTNYPLITTMRDFTPEERSRAFYLPYYGVRSFYFMAFHKSGIPKIVKDEYEDFAWVPKREMNKFLPRDSYNEFIKLMWDSC